MPLLNVYEYIDDNDHVEDICLPSLAEGDCRVAIKQVADLFDAVPPEEVHEHYTGSALWIRFLLPDRALFDNDFYNHVRLHCPGAVPELQKVVEAASAHFDCDFRSGSFFAAFALAWLDEASLPIVARFFHTIDAEHNGWFHEKEVLELAARHGWSLPMIDFTIVWLELADSTSGGGRPLDSGLRAGAKELMSAEDFAQRYHDVLARHGLGAYAKASGTQAGIQIHILELMPSTVCGSTTMGALLQI